MLERQTKGKSERKMRKLRLPRLISDKMVLKRDSKVRIWGYDEPGCNVTVSFLDGKYGCVTDSTGCFEVWLDEKPYGGPYLMEITDDKGVRSSYVPDSQIWSFRWSG